MSTIQWFPGHMAKATREAKEKLKLVDVVLELVDARIPDSSRNPVIDELVADKPHIIVLNKSDLADSRQTAHWINELESRKYHVVAIDAQHKKGLGTLINKIEALMQPTFEKYQLKGVKPRAIRLMILGIPNVGKSTLINRLVGKNQAITGNKPGVTKAQRWLKFSNKLELLDTPGILWPKFEDPDVGKKLAVTGAIKDTLFHKDDVALFLIDFLRQNYIEELIHYTQLSKDFLLDTQLPDILLEITQKRGYKEDYERLSEKMIYDFRQLKFGRITLDIPLKKGDEV